MNLLLPAAAGAFLVTASCSRNKDTEEVTPESQPSAAAPAADTTNTAAAAGAAVDSTAAMADSTAGAVQDSVTQPMDTSMAPHDSM